jgi:hypothetical protein
VATARAIWAGSKGSRGWSETVWLSRLALAGGADADGAWCQGSAARTGAAGPWARYCQAKATTAIGALGSRRKTRSTMAVLYGCGPRTLGQDCPDVIGVGPWYRTVSIRAGRGGHGAGRERRTIDLSVRVSLP